MWSYFVTDCGFSCLAKLAKPYPISGLTYMCHIPNLLHCMQNCAHEVFIALYWARLLAIFTLKPFALFLKSGCFVMNPALSICSRSLLLML